MKSYTRISIYNLLKKYNLFDRKIANINYYVNIAGRDAVTVIFLLAKLGFTDVDVEQITEKDLANLIYNLILKCDGSNPEYNKDLYVEMTRLGFRTNQFDYRNKENDLYCDDEFIPGAASDDIYGPFVSGARPGDLHDDYVDSMPGEDSLGSGSAKK